MNDEYICGLWRAYFLNGLLWWVESRPKADNSSSCRPHEYQNISVICMRSFVLKIKRIIAPTCACASMKGSARYPEISDKTYHVRLADIEVTPRTNDLAKSLAPSFKFTARLNLSRIQRHLRRQWRS